MSSPTVTPQPTTDAPASAALLERATRVIPGGVNSPVRAFRAVGGTPRFMASGSGPWLTDADGNRYVDLICSWGPMILGHAHPDVLAAVNAAAAQGFSFGTPSENEVLLAEEIVAPHGAGRAGPPRQLRHRGDDVGAAPRPRLHRPRRRREVRRLLPRPRRRPARVGRLGRRDLRAARLGGRAALERRRDDRAALQRPRRRSRPPSPSAATRSPPSSPRRRPATWASSPRRPASPRHCAASRPRTARCSSPTR